MNHICGTFHAYELLSLLFTLHKLHPVLQQQNWIVILWLKENDVKTTLTTYVQKVIKTTVKQ